MHRETHSDSRRSREEISGCSGRGDQVSRCERREGKGRGQVEEDDSLGDKSEAHMKTKCLKKKQCFLFPLFLLVFHVGTQSFGFDCGKNER